MDVSLVKLSFGSHQAHSEDIESNPEERESYVNCIYRRLTVNYYFRTGR